MQSITTPFRYILSCLLFFIAASSLGLFLRLAFVIDMPEWFEYRNIQHTHSHIALLGWLFGIFYILIVHVFKLEAKRFVKLFWALQLTVLGMMITFPMTGYNPLSIILTTIHIILVYVFAFRIWSETKHRKDKDLSILFLRASIIFLVSSTIGTLALGPIMTLGLKGSAIYYAAIQFYLHFQFNGWFVFALIAILLALIDKKRVMQYAKLGRTFFWLLCVATILTFALAVSWSTPRLSIFLINSVGVIFQLAALGVGIYFLRKWIGDLTNMFSLFNRRIIIIALVALGLKMLIQTAVVLPEIALISYTIRNFVIGFIHLLMLGCLSLFSLSIISKITETKLSIVGIFLFITGIVITEALLFVQGLLFWMENGFMPNYYLFIALGSILILIGIVIIAARWMLNQVQ